MKFDDFIEQTGQYGRYQKSQTFMAFFLVLPMAFQLFTQSIISSTPEFRCAIPDYSGDSYDVINESHQSLINASIPFNEDGTMSQCYIRVNPENNQSATAYHKCNKWVYDRSIFQSSVVEDLELGCRNFFLKSTTKAAFMLGGLLGTPFLARLNDVYGRKLLCLIPLLGIGVFAIISAWVQNVYAVIVLRVLMGVCDSVTYMSIVYICIEIVGPPKRNMANHLIAVSYACCAALLLTFAPFIDNWRWLQTVVSFSSLMAVPYFWLLRESPRWLLSVGRDDEAETIMREMAELNGSEYPTDLIERLETDYHENQGKWTDLFVGGKMIIMTVILCYNWFVVAVVYYGISMGMDRLRSPTFYLDLGISALAEIPGYLLSWYLSDRIGRKHAYSLLVSLTSLSLLSTIFPVLYGSESHVWIVITLTMLGKGLGAGAYAAISLYTPEMYPTTMRSTATAVALFISRIGTFVAPYVGDLAFLIPGPMSRVLHLLIFGGLALVAAVLNFQLPETMKTQLPDTVAHVTALHRFSLQMHEAAFLPTNGCQADIDQEEEEMDIYLRDKSRMQSNL